jgi:hypothetical protein
VATGDAAVLLEAVHQPLDPVALAVPYPVEGSVAPVIRSLVAAARDHRANAAARQHPAHRRVAIPAVAHEAHRPHAWPSTPGPPHLPALEELLHVP